MIVGVAVIWQIARRCWLALLVYLPSVFLWAWGVVVGLCHALHGTSLWLLSLLVERPFLLVVVIVVVV